jgi:hypothetical protein
LPRSKKVLNDRETALINRWVFLSCNLPMQVPYALLRSQSSCPPHSVPLTLRLGTYVCSRRRRRSAWRSARAS